MPPSPESNTPTGALEVMGVSFLHAGDIASLQSTDLRVFPASLHVYAHLSFGCGRVGGMSLPEHMIKAQGTGNDFVMYADRSGEHAPQKQDIIQYY